MRATTARCSVRTDQMPALPRRYKTGPAADRNAQTASQSARREAFVQRSGLRGRVQGDLSDVPATGCAISAVTIIGRWGRSSCRTVRQGFFVRRLVNDREAAIHRSVRGRHQCRRKQGHKPVRRIRFRGTNIRHDDPRNCAGPSCFTWVPTGAVRNRNRTPT